MASILSVLAHRSERAKALIRPPSPRGGDTEAGQHGHELTLVAACRLADRKLAVPERRKGFEQGFRVVGHRGRQASQAVMERHRFLGHIEADD